MRTKLIILTALSLIAINLKAQQADTTQTQAADTTNINNPIADTTTVKVQYADSTTAADTTELHYELEGTTLTINGTTQTADRRTFTFSNEDKQRVYGSMELMATLPGLRTDLQTGNLVSSAGDAVLILINGIQATNAEVKALPKNKIKSVESYDIPPARYAQYEVDKVINIITSPLDDGFIVSIDADYGLTSHFSDDNIYFSWTHGRNKLTVNYDFSWRDVKNRQFQTTYDYDLHLDPDNPDELTHYSLTYWEKNHFGYEDHEPSVKYSYVNNDKTVLEITAKPNFEHRYSLGSGTGTYKEGDGETRDLTTLDNSKTNTFSPSLDAYFSQRLSPKDELSLNAVGTYYNVKQPLSEDEEYFTDDGEPAFIDNRDLHNTKWSIIGEVAYSRSIINSSAKWNTGYRAQASFLHSNLTSTGFGGSDFKSRFMTHYAYTEISGVHNDLTYRVSLGLSYTDNNSAYDDPVYATHVKNLHFTPRVVLGYNLPHNNTLRFQYLRSPSSPDINDLTTNVSNSVINILSVGNPELKNSVTQTATLMYNYYNDYIDLSLNVKYAHTKNPIVQYFREDTYEGEGDYEGKQVLWSNKVNGSWQRIRGFNLNLEITPFGNDMLDIWGGIAPYRTTLHSNELDYGLTSLSNYFGVEFNYKWFSFDYQGKIPVFQINGSYKSTEENMHAMMAQFRVKGFKFSATWLWIGKGAHYVTESLPGLAVTYTGVTDLFDQKNLVLLGVSYYFQSGKNRDVSRKLSNADYSAPTR